MSKNIREFLLRVLPWPSDDEPGYINLHAQMHINGKTPWTGYPLRDVDNFLQQVYTCLSWKTPPDLYYCMSRQGLYREHQDGRNLAARSQDQALALKAVYLDLDVKEKGYSSVSDAVNAITKFCESVPLPTPSAYVASGGGLHVYWISQNPLSPMDWEPYANGLKNAASIYHLLCDAGVTGDSARVLRVPGTFNYKLPTPRPVKLLGIKEKDYDFAQDLSALLAIPGTVSAGRIAPTPPPILGRPSSVFSSLPVESLAEGITREPLLPLEWTPLVKECGWFREALTVGGKDFSQGMWNLTTLAATFLENGHALAHKMAKGHAGYSYGETEALWERKQCERRDRGLGWPSCSAIQTEGCRHCAVCPHLGKIKSPLNLARVPKQAVAPAVATFVANSPAGTVPVGPSGLALTPLTDVDMPNHTFKVIGGIINKLEERPGVQGQPATTVPVPLFNCQLYNPWAQTNTDALHFTTSVDKGNYRAVCIPMAKMTTIELESELLRGGVSPVSENLKHVKGFIVSWLAKLNSAAAAHTNVPFGWSMNGNKCEGFSYGGILYKSDGTLGPSTISEPILREMYTPKGDEEPWREAFEMVIAEQRPGLQAILATAFGSPLMVGAGEYVGVLSVWGKETGARKSTAMRVALGVWGNPKLLKENERATENSVFKRLGQIRNLPYMWDEIKDDEAQAKAHNILLSSGAKEKARLKSDTTMQVMGDWENLIVIAANRCFSDFVLKKDPETAAGVVRLFEWEEKKPRIRSPGIISASDAGRTLRLVDDNYGGAGKRWSAFLGTNYELCRAHVTNNSHLFEKAVEDPNRDTTEERFWIAMASAIQSGAELANEHLGLNFDTVALREFLVAKIREQRRTAVAETQAGGTFDHTEETLTAFLKAYRKQTMRTYRGPPQANGKLAPIEVTLNPDKGYPSQIQWVVEQNELRFSKREFNSWLMLPVNKGNPRQMRQALVQHFGAHIDKGMLGMGTTIKENREELYRIKVIPNTPLWDMMMKVGGSDDQGAGNTGKDTTPRAPDANQGQA